MPVPVQPIRPLANAGTYRSITRLREGWWVSLVPLAGGAAQWRQITNIFDVSAAGIRIIVLTLAASGGEPEEKIKPDVRYDVLSLTEREAAKLGLS